MRMLKRKNLPILIGFLVWLIFSLVSFPASTFSLSYVQILILAAPLWLIPLTWQLLDTPEWTDYLGVPFAILLAIAFYDEPSLKIALLTLPWLFLTTLLAFQKWLAWRIVKSLEISHLTQLAAYLYLPIGAAWAFADRLGFRPLDFDATIVLLTVAHFHYAGFLLPTITAFALKSIATKWRKTIGWLVILGIPAVAIGITTTHLHLPVWIEVAAVTVMVLGGLITGVLHCILGWENRQQHYGKLWLIAGVALMVGMALACGYGWRHVYIIPVLSIPWMYAVHGTLNAVGFALPAVLGWSYYARSNEI